MEKMRMVAPGLSKLASGFDYLWDDTVEPHSLPGFLGGWRWDDVFLMHWRDLQDFFICALMVQVRRKRFFPQ